MFNQLKAAASQFSGNKTDTANTNTNTAQGNSTAAGGGPDALDKGIEFISGKLGMKNSHAQTEKYSDMARAQYKKMTGKDIPITDKEYK